MSLRRDGTYHCDRCGVDIGNAGYLEAVSISGADPTNPVEPRRLHLCLTHEVDGQVVEGCQDLVLNADALHDYHSTRG